MVALPQLQPQNLGKWEGEGQCLVSEKSGGRKQTLEPLEVLISAFRGAFPVRGWGSLVRKSRGANGIAWLRARPSRLGDLMSPIKVPLPPLGQTSGPLTQASAPSALHPSPHLTPFPPETGWSSRSQYQ